MRVDARGIRLVALDVDGTLVARGNRISPATRSALHGAHAAGLELVICTGRRYRTTRVVIDALGLEVPAVCLGGALVKERDGATLAVRSYPAEAFREVAGRVRDRGFVVVAQRDSHEHGGADFLIDGSLPWDRFAQAYQRRHERHAEWRSDLPAEPREDVLVVGTFGSREALLELAAEIEQRFEGRYSSHVMPVDSMDGFYCEVAPREVDKWSALAELGRGRGVAPEAICAVGDGVNDVSMIRAAGLGVAMANAHESARACADWVTGRHDEDGLVAVVERILGAAD